MEGVGMKNGKRHRDTCSGKVTEEQNDTCGEWGDEERTK